MREVGDEAVLYLRQQSKRKMDSEDLAAACLSEAPGVHLDTNMKQATYIVQRPIAPVAGSLELSGDETASTAVAQSRWDRSSSE